MVELKASDIIKECKDLKNYWSVRTKSFTEWYDLLLLTDNLAQEDMESVISNDPRTSYDLGMRLLTSTVISHKIPTEDLERPEIIDTAYLERYIEKQWTRVTRDHRKTGRQSWLRELVSFILATGWYSVFVWCTNDSLIAEIWNPANVFQEYDSDGLSRCAHIYSLTALSANRKTKKMGWSIPRPYNTDVTLYNYWFLDEDGDVSNAIVLGTYLVKPVTKLAPNEQAFDGIPIFTSPVAGLPDTGIIKASSKDWQKHFGESIVAPNASEYNNQNKMLSFVQQLMRDAATPRWVEKSRSGGILTEETIFKRGGIFRMTPEEDIGALPVNPIPLELRTILFEYGNRIQRGAFPWALYGNLQQQLAGYVVSQIAAAAMGVVAPYADGIKAVLSDVDNYWFHEIKERGLRPYNFKMPSNIPDNIEFVADLNIEVPGSLVQRATVARMLDPTFKLSFTSTADMLFPEIKDPIKEQARSNKDEALTNPIAQALALIATYKEEARISEEAGDMETAELFTSAASMVQSQLSQQGQPQPTAGIPPVPREVMPREEVTPTPPMGEV